MNKISIIKGLIDRMSIEEKIGQCLVIGFTGTVITPKILERIRKYTPAGIRAGLTFRMKSALHDPYATSEKFFHRVFRHPTGTVKDILPDKPVPVCTNEEYCNFLNTMKKTALEGRLSIPLHITFDMSGDSVDYFYDGIRFFPYPMGITDSGNLQMAYDCAWAVARQTVPLGFNWIHSPVLDVNTNPLNPEVGISSYSGNYKDVARFATEALKGYQDGGLITTGKHFPGRGESISDAHHGLPVISLSKKEMEEHLFPFQMLIDAGLPAIMSAHSAYPSLDPSGLPASLSKTIITDLLKGKMGFKGAVTTDDITMGGIVEKFEVSEACIMALNAGNDLILFRDESTLIDEVYPVLVDAARSGIIKESRLNDAIFRSLSVKYDYGLFDADKGVRIESRASEGIDDKKVREIAKTSAKEAVRLVRTTPDLLPLGKEQKILLVEQVNPLHKLANSQECHTGILWENLLKYSDNVAMVETNPEFSDNDQVRIKRRVEECDIIIMTNYFYRRSACKNKEFIIDLQQSSHKPLIVITNSPYPLSVAPEFETVVVTYGASPEIIVRTAELLFSEPE